MTMSMERDARIWVAGHRGLVGSALVRRLGSAGFDNLLCRTHSEVDLTDAAAVAALVRAERPQFVFLAAAKVGGIRANATFPADFIRENLRIQTNVIDAAHRFGVRRLVFLGSSCIYPKLAPQPMREDALLTGPLEPTNDAYAIAKIAGIKMCESYNRQYGTDFVPVMPTNLYGPNDNFDLENSHVLPALLRKFHAAKVAGDDHVTIWGSGAPRREFLHVDDMADACVFVMQKAGFTDLVNIGTGDDLSIRELAVLIGEVVGFDGKLVFDASKPDGTPRKLLDVSRLAELGWRAQICLREGIVSTYKWYCLHQAALGDTR